MKKYTILLLIFTCLSPNLAFGMKRKRLPGDDGGQPRKRREISLSTDQEDKIIEFYKKCLEDFGSGDFSDVDSAYEEVFDEITKATGSVGLVELLTKFRSDCIKKSSYYDKMGCLKFLLRNFNLDLEIYAGEFGLTDVFVKRFEAEYDDFIKKIEPSEIDEFRAVSKAHFGQGDELSRILELSIVTAREEDERRQQAGLSKPLQPPSEPLPLRKSEPSYEQLEEDQIDLTTRLILDLEDSESVLQKAILESTKDVLPEPQEKVEKPIVPQDLQPSLRYNLGLFFQTCLAGENPRDFRHIDDFFKENRSVVDFGGLISVLIRFKQNCFRSEIRRDYDQMDRLLEDFMGSLKRYGLPFGINDGFIRDLKGVYKCYYQDKRSNLSSVGSSRKVKKPKKTVIEVDEKGGEIVQYDKAINDYFRRENVVLSDEMLGYLSEDERREYRSEKSKGFLADCDRLRVLITKAFESKNQDEYERAKIIGPETFRWSGDDDDYDDISPSAGGLLDNSNF